jgi:hypothetical protein
VFCFHSTIHLSREDFLPQTWMQRCWLPMFKENVSFVEVAKNPEADHAPARWQSLPSGVPFLGPEGPCGYQVKPEARPHREPSTMKSVEAAVAQSFHLFGAFAEITAGATEKEASCHSTGERSNRWPFACGMLIAGVLYSPCRLNSSPLSYRTLLSKIIIRFVSMICNRC